jgi:hypothetical protein
MADRNMECPQFHVARRTAGQHLQSHRRNRIVTLDSNDGGSGCTTCGCNIPAPAGFTFAASKVGDSLVVEGVVAGQGVKRECAAAGLTEIGGGGPVLRVQGSHP